MTEKSEHVVEEQILAALSDFHAAEKANDLDKMVAAFTEEGTSNGIPRTSREAVRPFFRRLVDLGVFKSIAVDMERCEIRMDGDVVTAEPVIYNALAGRLVKSYDLKKETDGAWRILNDRDTAIPEDSEHISTPRVVDRPIEDVWACLTQPEHLEQWMCNQAKVDLRVGGQFELTGDYVYQHGGGQRITALEPGRLITFTWPFDSYTVEVTWRLESHLDMTRVTLEHVMTHDDAKQFLRDRPAFNFTIMGTYNHHLIAYLEMGFAPSRLDCNPAPPDLFEIRFDMTLPVSATDAMAGLVEVDRIERWLDPGLRKDWGWPGEVAKDGKSARFHDDPRAIQALENGRGDLRGRRILQQGDRRQVGQLFAVIAEGDPSEDEALGAVFTVRAITSEDGPKATLKFVLSGFGDIFGIYWGWQGYMVTLALHLVKGYDQTRTWSGAR